MNTKEAANELRKTLKTRFGYTGRDVSVRIDGSAIRVSIKRRGIALDTIEEAANPFARIDRCNITGEILSGGNRFVTVEYDFKLLRTIRDEVRAECEDAFAWMSANRGKAKTVAGIPMVWPMGGRDLCDKREGQGIRLVPAADVLASYIARQVAGMEEAPAVEETNSQADWLARMGA